MIQARTALRGTLIAVGVMAFAVVLKGFPTLAAAFASVLRWLLSPIGIILVVALVFSRKWRRRPRPTPSQQPSSRTD